MGAKINLKTSGKKVEVGEKDEIPIGEVPQEHGGKIGERADKPIKPKGGKKGPIPPPPPVEEIKGVKGGKKFE